MHIEEIEEEQPPRTSPVRKRQSRSPREVLEPSSVSVLDRLSAELSGNPPPPDRNNAQDSQDVDSLLDKLSKQLAKDPSAWTEVLDSLGSPINSTEKNAKTPVDAGMLAILPEPGFAVKTSIEKVPGGSKEKDPTRHPVVAKLAATGLKVFIDLCHSAQIPAPPPATDEEIRAAINAEDNVAWKVPLSLAEPREDKDKAGAPCLIFSACVHTSPYRKAESDADFKLFLIELALEWVEERSGLGLSRRFSLPKLKSKGQMAKHWIRKESKRPGIAEVSEKSGSKGIVSGVSKGLKTVISPDYFVTKVKSNRDIAETLVAVIYLPEVKTLNASATLDLEPNRLKFSYAPSLIHENSPEQKSYHLDISLKEKVDPTKTRAKFSTRDEVLRVRMPLIA